MKNTLLLLLSGVGTLFVSCGGSDQTVAHIAALTTTTEVAERETLTQPKTAPTKTALPYERTYTASFGSGAARTYQQKRERLRLLALAQKVEDKNVRKGKKSGFFGILFRPSRNSAAKYPRTKNNLSSMNQFWRRSGSRRRR